MSNENGVIQQSPLLPPNAPTITETDRARIYAIIGKELNNILNGPASYYPDSVKKDSVDLTSELQSFIGAVTSLKGVVNDPTGILESAVRDLNEFASTFKNRTSDDVEAMWNNEDDKRDQRIRLPDSIAPTTEDHNIIYVDPNPDPFFPPPNPVAPRKERSVSSGSPSAVATNSIGANAYQQSSSADANTTRYLRGRVMGKSDPGVPVAPMSMPLAGPLSLNDAYLEYRRRLDAGQPQASAVDTEAAAAPLAGRPEASVFDRAAPAAPFVAPNNPFFPDRFGSYGGRAGSGPSSADAGAPLAPYMTTSLPQPARPLGLFSGQPIPNYPVGPPIFGVDDRSEAFRKDAQDWSDRVVRPYLD
ncbi:hypothetical protein [Bradyrhizobium sp. NP1]|uniref:hypothetical protein n=1 Tax=Bradyrhizobium sp. NP1 TaxID=3049772 RepID=UPI0025A50E77|nr:hypothetical protein [Bradyrhizobium sp. NP1]WJR76482.1 hypothetical protein QOU61_27515 [Bradyrhizobium sp. NP1]